MHALWYAGYAVVPPSISTCHSFPQDIKKYIQYYSYTTISIYYLTYMNNVLYHLSSRVSSSKEKLFTKSKKTSMEHN